MKLRFVLPLISLLVLLCISRSAYAEPFKDGDRWTVIGDDITQGGTYPMWVDVYYATRFPNWTIKTFNAGSSGDSAKGAVQRYDWDIKPNRSTVATIMFGMNDVKRDLYGDVQPTANVLASRVLAFTNYRTYMNSLMARLKADGTRIIVLTPTIYDETTITEQAPQLGVNAALASWSALLPRIAAGAGAQVIDLRTEMDAITARVQPKDPIFSLLQPDRIHPNEYGNFVMAYLFLKAQGVPSVVSSVSIDAPTSSVKEAVNATVDKVQTAGGGIYFTILEKALPFPVDKEVQPALAWVPLEQELNREMLQINGLAAGDYDLLIDGQKVRRFGSPELAAGVNIGPEKGTPQSVQAAGVLALARRWQITMAQKVRLIAQFEYGRLGDVAHPISFEAVRPRLEKEMDRLRDRNSEADRAEFDSYQRYYDTKPTEATNLAKLADLETQIHRASQPQPHVWELRPVQP